MYAPMPPPPPSPYVTLPLTTASSGTPLGACMSTPWWDRPPLRHGAQLRPARLPGLDLLLEGRDLVVELVVASLDLRVLGGGLVPCLPGVGGGLAARRARQQRDRGGSHGAARDENAPNR